MTLRLWNDINQVNTNLAVSANQPDATTLADGRYLVAWDENNDIRAQIFNADGTVSGVEMLLFDGTTSGFAVSIEALPGGGFAAFFINGGQIERRSYDSSGNILSSATVAATIGDLGPDIAFDHGQLFAVLSDTSSTIRLFTYSVTNDALTFINAENGNSDITGDQQDAQIAISASGVRAIVWNDTTADSVEIRFFGSAGAALGPDQTVAGAIGGVPYISVVALANGGFIVTYSKDTTNFPGDGFDLYGRIYAPDGSAYTGEFMVNTAPQGYDDVSKIVALADDGFIVFWYDGDTSSLRARQFDGTGNAFGNTLTIATEITPFEDFTGATWLSDGRVLLTWEQDSQIFQRIIDPRDGEVAGGFDADTLYGSFFDDNISGFTGADTLYGMEGHDRLFGGEDVDTLDGGDGADWLYGNAGVDTLLGGEGNDVLEGGTGADVLIGGDGWNIASYVNSTGGVAVNLFFNSGASNDAQGDTYTNIHNVWGSAFNDIIRGTATENILEGRGGGDQLLGDGGNDILRGGAGNDFLAGGAGADVLDGGSNTDTADYSGSAARVLINLFFGNALEGDAQGDTLISIENVFGSAGNDIIRGSTNTNVLRGGAGADTLTGDGGADFFQYNTAAFGNDLITDFADAVDKLDFRGSGLTAVNMVVQVSAGDTFISFTGNAGHVIKLDNFVGTFDVADCVF